MPEDAVAAMAHLLRCRPEHDLVPVRAMDRSIDVAVAALDYGDRDHVFQVTVELVPRRRWAPEPPLRIGDVDGVAVDLVEVTVDTFVHVRLTAAPTDERDRLTREYRDAWEQWEATYEQTRAAPPDQPGTRLVPVSVTVQDELGTDYVVQGGQAGVDDAVWDLRRSFRPRPPAEVRALHLTLQAPGQAPASVTATW